MIAFDTNVIARFILRDDEKQANRVDAVVARIVDTGDRIYLTTTVIVELVWVLSKRYRFDRQDIVKELWMILSSDYIEIEDREKVRSALESYASGPADFADYFIGVQAFDANCALVMTFDKDLLRDPRFLEP